MKVTKTNLDKYKLLDEFQGHSDLDQRVYGNVEGFILTTSYIPSKDTSIQKEEVIEMWEQLKTNKRLWRLYENHRNDLPPIGYLRKAQLYEKGDWCGIYTVTAVTNKDALQKMKDGLLSGFSVATRIKKTSDEKKAVKKTVSIDIEAKAYDSDQIAQIKSSFPSEYKVVVNEVYRFSELPPLIINLAINIDIQNIVAVIIQRPVETTALVSAGIVLKKGLELIVEDIYKFLKKTAKRLFDNKNKRKPIVITNTNLLDKEVVIRNSPDSPSEMIKNMKIIKLELSKLSKSKLLTIAKAKRVFIEVKEGKVQISPEV